MAKIERVKLSKLTSIRVGGECDVFTPDSIFELQNFLATSTKNIFFLGLGSNLIVSDNGFDGVIIRTKNLNNIEFKNGKIKVECGTTLAGVSRFAVKNSQSSANFLSAIPGSIGGALKMNAGCFGREIWQFVKSIQTIDNNGILYNRNIDDFVVNYRSVVAKYKNEHFLNCELVFENNGLSDDVLKQRYQSQPIGTANFGSVFKNPKGHFAAQLIENAGLKGHCVGSSCISTKHANFIINENNAKSLDILTLIKHTQKIVFDKFAIKLATEVIFSEDLP